MYDFDILHAGLASDSARNGRGKMVPLPCPIDLQAGKVGLAKQGVRASDKRDYFRDILLLGRDIDDIRYLSVPALW